MGLVAMYNSSRSRGPKGLQLATTSTAYRHFVYHFFRGQVGFAQQMTSAQGLIPRILYSMYMSSGALILSETTQGVEAESHSVHTC